MRILVAEDELDIARTYKMVLEDRGHDVTVTENGEECLDVYSNELKRMKINTDNNRQNNDNSTNALIISHYTLHHLHLMPLFLIIGCQKKMVWKLLRK